MKRGLLHYRAGGRLVRGSHAGLCRRGLSHLLAPSCQISRGGCAGGHVATRDWKEYQELPDCLLPDDRDVSLTTGSVLYHEGVYHAFYAAAGRTVFIGFFPP